MQKAAVAFPNCWENCHFETRAFTSGARNLARSKEPIDYTRRAGCVLQEKHRTMKHRSDSLVPDSWKILKLAICGATYRSRNC
jgi:hypothetical protein